MSTMQKKGPFYGSVSTLLFLHCRCFDLNLVIFTPCSLYHTAVDSDKWECEHCTYHNPITRRICEVCCKTSSNSPRPTGNSQFGGVAQGTSRETQVRVNAQCYAYTG